MSEIAASMGDWADGARTLVVSSRDDAERLAGLAGLPCGWLVHAASVEEACRALCGERFATLLFALPLRREALEAAVAELRLVRQGPAIVVVGEPADRARVLEHGATAFVDRRELTPAALRTVMASATAAGERVSRLVEHVAHLRRVVDSLLEGVLLSSPEGRLLYANERAIELLGIPADELLFRPFPVHRLELRDEHGARLAPADLATMRAVRSGRSVETSVHRLVRPDGTVRWVEVLASLLRRAPAADPYAVVACFRDVTAERKANAAHLAAERRRRLLHEHAADGYLVLDRALLVVEAGSSVERLWPGAVAGVEAISLVHPDDRETVLRALAGGRTDRTPIRHVELRTAGGRWLEATITNRLDEPSIGGLVVNVSEITDRKEAERARRFAEERFRLGFEHGTAGMSITDLEGRIVEVNPALCELLGEPAVGLVGTTIAHWVHEGDQEDRRSLRKRLLDGEIDRYRSERRYVRRDGSVVWCLLSVSLIRDTARRPLYFFSQFQDITDHKSNEEALEHRVQHDVLTGLPNRRGLQRKLDGALARAGAAGSKVAVLFLDLDRFKVVNDGLGHAVGDAILVEMASRLATGVRERDTVARFGGDEFIVVCEEVCDLAEADDLARRTTALFEEPFQVEGKPLYVSASCGVALVDGTATAEEALRDADAAMYEAKERGRGRPQVFDERLRRAVAERLDIEQALQVALERGQLRVVYQPVVAVPTGCPVGVEALVRWDHPERGTLSPGEFFPAAEASGVIVRIDDFVLQQAVAQVARWRNAGAGHLWVAVNLSPRQLAFGNPAARCERVLGDHRLPPDALRLELTESALLGDVDAAVRMLEELGELGVAVAIDDFGTGHSSLAYLSRLPVTQLKIDRSLVGAVGVDPHAPDLMRAITGLAAAMGLETCAEGVEDEGQRALVDELGCPLAQGYLWSPPRRPEDLADLLLGDRARAIA